MTDSVQFASGFAPATKADWLGEVRRVLLKGRPEATDEEFAEAFTQRLVTRTEDGLAIQPLYTAEDAPVHGAAPGQAPFIRSTHTAPTAWEIRQRVWPEAPGSSAAAELESGATGVLIQMAGSPDLASTLEGVLLDLAPVSLSGASIEQAGDLLDLWESAGIRAQERRGSLGIDLLGAWARSGGAGDLDPQVDALAALVQRGHEHAAQARVVLVDGTVWHDAGATDAQELAWSIAAGLWVTRALVDRGVDLATVVRSIEFRFAATAEQFATIAKLRAARWLWSRALEVAGIDEVDRAMCIHAECSRVMLTRYDVEVNILRSTVATFAAAVGGADAITVPPYDLLLRAGGSPLGRRIARNTQSILMLEANLARVIDPAGGSWFVESLTRDLAAQAWTMVRESEREGGILRMLEGGGITSMLAATRESRNRAISHRRRPITGVSEFPNIDEHRPVILAEEASAEGVRFEPLTLHRLAEDFEAQRARADAMATRPVIYLAALGTPAQSTARSTFAKNFFEAAGIATLAGDVEGFAASGAELACLCSTDPVYSDQGAAAVEILRAAGARRIFLAGRGARVPGVDEEIGIGVDVLDVLSRTLDEIGAPR